MTLVLLRHLVNNSTIDTKKLHIEFGSVNFKKEYSSDTKRILQEIHKNKNFSVYSCGYACTNGAIMCISPIAISNIPDNNMKNEVKKQYIIPTVVILMHIQLHTFIVNYLELL